MKFTILSHASMLVEVGDVRLVTDPWLIGSCYWRSWWNYPPPPRPLVNDLRATHIYITHLHWDHFQGPSLKKLFSSDVKLLVPKASFPRMVDDLRACGFNNIEEIPHGVSRQIGELTLTSYQFGIPLDSCLVISDGQTTLVDANDCKLMAGPLRQVARRHPHVDFVFRSHSSANPYPACLRTDNEEWKKIRQSEDYMHEFLAFAETLGARYAIPFASNHCFLHRDTRQFNATVVSPEMVRDYYFAHRRGDSECVVMIPGDSWGDQQGFDLQEHDYFTNRESHLQAYEERFRSTLEDYYRQEEHVRDKLPWKAFVKYFQGMLDAMPWGSSWLFGPRVAFRVLSGEPQHWLVDFTTKKINDCGTECPPCEFVLEMPTSILRDCVGKRMFSTLMASKRVTVEIREGSLGDAMKFDLLRDLYESDYLPLRSLFRRRFVGNWLRRWRESLLYLKLLVKLKVLRRELDLVTLIRQGQA